MKYSHDYSKLKKPMYSTIRKYAKGKEGDIVDEIYPSGRHLAKIINVERKKLCFIKTDFLLKDTDCKSRKEAIELLQSFYKNPITSETYFYVYMLRKIRTPAEADLMAYLKS